MGLIADIVERLYRSPWGRAMSAAARALSIIKRPFMIYGYYDKKSSSFRKFSRVSDSVVIQNRANLSMGEFVWVGHHCILDATEGLTLEEGCQIAGLTGIFTHGSHVSIRLYGRQYVNVHFRDRVGYTRGPVKVGAYTFVGAGAIILPGVTVGRGCIIGAGSLVNRDVPDYSVAVGSPAKVIGSTRELDKPFLGNEEIRRSYYDRQVVDELLGPGYETE